jgi:hypothetical protein
MGKTIMTHKHAWQAALPGALVCSVLIGHDAQAQSAVAPPSDPGYWTKERMDNARPIELHPPAGYTPQPRQRPRTDGKAVGERGSPPQADPANPRQR